MTHNKLNNSRSADTALVAVLVCIAASISMAIAMGVGRFAFTPFFPLMVRDGLLANDAGAMIAASNYLGYLIGALVTIRFKLKSTTLLTVGLMGTVVFTAAVGLTTEFSLWVALRFFAGVMSAWTLVGTSVWGLGWLTVLGRPYFAGAVFSGVGLGIAATGVFCFVASGADVSSQSMWVELAGFAGIFTLLPVLVSWRFGIHDLNARPSVPKAPLNQLSSTGGLIFCYTLFGFGYILPATYLPVMARQLVDDPQLFGLAWPLFGTAAALSTIVIAWGLKKTSRLKVWSVSHFLMASGVFLPAIWTSLSSIFIAALLVGGNFMVITMVAMQEARERAAGNATVVLGRMTAGFASGQLMGPVVSAVLGRFTDDYFMALNYALQLSACSLVLSACYLWRESGRRFSYSY